MPFKFSENEKVDSLEDIKEEELRPFYQEVEGGGFEIKPELADSAKAFDAVVHANVRIRKENKTLNSSNFDLSPLSEYGTTPDEILTKFTAQKKEMSDALDAKEGMVNPNKIRQDMKKAHDLELSEEQAKTKSYEKQLFGELVTNHAHKSIAKHDGSPLLMRFVKEQVRMVHDKHTDKYVPEVIDNDGDLRSNRNGLPMSVDELVADMKKNSEYAALFTGQKKQGANTPANRVNTGGPKAQGANKSPASKIQSAIDNAG